MTSTLLSTISTQFHALSIQQQQFFLKTLGARLFSEANDIKRTRAALAKELGWNEQTIADIFSGQAEIEQTLALLSLLIQKYPLSLKDLWLDLPLDQGCVVVEPEQSLATSRVFNRLCDATNPNGAKSPYYEYRDTAMAAQAPFRPEWILELRQVSDANPYNPEVIYNNGHLMNQFTFFIGEVNFYWEDQGKKYSREMNTGDSCHITPFAPHTFTSRNPDHPGLIIAVTYGDQIRRANNQLALDAQAQPSYLAEVFQNSATKREVHSPFNLALRFHLDADLQTSSQLAKQAEMDLQRLEELLSHAVPTSDELQRLAQALQLRPEDLYQPIDAAAVEFAFFDQTPWIINQDSNSRHKALARSQSQPGMKSFILEINNTSRCQLQQHASHQYVYNYGKQPVLLHLHSNEQRLLAPGASCYVQPYIAHSFSAPDNSTLSEPAQLLIVRLAGELNQAAHIELSQVNQSGRQRLLNETSQWF